jgi:hypothetical protein
MQGLQRVVVAGLMLTTPDVQRLLARVKYKPGFEFKAYDGRWEGQQVVIRVDMPDAYNPGQTVTLDIHSPLPPQRDEDTLYSWLAWRLGRIENHEMREYLRIDGDLYSDPHAPYSDRDL